MRWVIYGVAGLALVVAAAIAIVAVKVIEDGPNQSGGLLGQPTIGGAFELVDGEGKTVTHADFAGKHMVVYFGFTHCPDICPTELSAIANALDLMAPADAAQFQPIFVTVDPERDTPDVVKEYASHFHERMIGLTGAPEQIKAMAKTYRIYYAKQEPKTPGAPYQVAHTSYIYVMDRQGMYVRHFAMGAQPEDIAAGLTATLGGV